jgi:HEAT repeat protein
MGLLDFFGGGGTKVERLVKAATQKYGPPENRQKALEQLVELGTPEAIAGMLKRFTISAEPSITDRDEKEFVYRAVLDFDKDAVVPLQNFVRNSETAIAWALKGLGALTTPPEVVEVSLAALTKLGPEYTRDPEKKTVLLTQLLDHDDPRIVPAVIPFLEDPADDVKIAASKILAKSKSEAARQPLLDAIPREKDHKRVLSAFFEALATAAFKVDTVREQLLPLLPEGFAISKEGLVQART